jgi:hypothetical protein
MMMTITTRAVTTSPHEVSASIVFPLSKPFSFPQPLPVAQEEEQSSDQRLWGMPCDQEPIGMRRDRGEASSGDEDRSAKGMMPAGCHSANMLASNTDAHLVSADLPGASRWYRIC